MIHKTRCYMIEGKRHRERHQQTETGEHSFYCMGRRSPCRRRPRRSQKVDGSGAAESHRHCCRRSRCGGRVKPEKLSAEKICHTIKRGFFSQTGFCKKHPSLGIPISIGTKKHVFGTKSLCFGEKKHIQQGLHPYYNLV